MQTEVALRMTTAGLEVERVDTPAIDLSTDPDFPGVEVARDTHPVVTGRLTGDAAGRRVLIAGHIDVVSAAATSWPGRRRRFGRGSRTACSTAAARCDMKGGVVAGLGALRAIAEAGVELGGEAMLVTVPGEEDGGAGMLAAIRAGCTGDWAVITEPTRLEIVTAQAGAITFTLTVTGKSAHAAFRRRGVSAVEKLVAGDGRAGAQRAGAKRGREAAVDARPGPALPHRHRPRARRRLVVDRARAAGGRGPLRRARRPDGGRGGGGAARRAWPPPAPATSGCATTRSRCR